MTRSLSLPAMWLLAGSAAWAQTSYPMISHVHPAGVRRGATTEVTISGKENFAGAYQLLFDGNPKDFTVEIPPAPAPAPAATKAAPGKAAQLNDLKVKITVGPDVAAGVREFRVATVRGVSSIGLLVVSDEPEVLEVEPNDTPETAQAVTLPVTVNGKLDKPEDVDWYKFRAEAGDEVAFSVLSARLQHKMHDLQAHVDPMLTLTDSAGRELAGSDDYFVADPYFSYKFDKAGEYRVAIRDVRYQGNRAWTYRLTMTRRPFVLNVFPPCVQAGKPAELRPVGSCFAADAAVRITVPADAAPGLRELPLDFGAGKTSNPVSLLIASAAPGVEQEPNDTPDRAGVIGEGGVNGRIEPAGDVDWYRLPAKAKETLILEVWSRRLGNDLDSVLSIHDAAGKLITSNDDSPGVAGGGVGKDSKLVWTAPADGEYRVRVSDLHGRGGPTFAYCLTCRKSEPDFTLRCDPDKAQVGPGTSTAWWPIIERTGGFEGAVKVEVQGLPAGVTASPLTIGPKMLQGCIVVTAAADAKPAAGHVRIIGTAVVKGADGKETALVRPAVPIQEIYLPGGGRGRYPVGLQTVSVTEPSDITVIASADKLQLAPGGTARIEIEVKRSAGYTGPVSLDIPLRHLESIYTNPLPAGVTLAERQSKMRLGPTETKGWIVLSAAKDAAPIENVPIAVVGWVSINFVVKVGYSTKVIELNVKP